MCETPGCAQRMGLDPTLGLMHADKRYRPSLASDLMEPVRPTASRLTLTCCSSVNCGAEMWSRLVMAPVGSDRRLLGNSRAIRIRSGRLLDHTPTSSQRICWARQIIQPR